MKVQKVMSSLATLSILSLAVACNSGGGSTGGTTSDRYAEGFTAGKAQGYSEGYDNGYDDGDADGYVRAEAFFKTADYSKGLADGKALGITLGYSQGYNVGKTDGQALGYTSGYNVGKSDGQALGYTTGYNVGYSDGYDDGYDDGDFDGYERGYDNGFDDGYDVGYDDGYDDGSFSLSVGKTKKLAGYADILSAFHNDLIDYSSIKAPVQTKLGLVANGQLLLSESSLTNKDTLKRAAVVEQYLVVEMAKQVKGKFALSDERSLKVAKAANHFRKFVSTRALTAADANAYASEIIGADFKSIEKAYDSSMKGDFSSLKSVLQKAADKNGVSPEKMGDIMTSMFL